MMEHLSESMIDRMSAKGEQLLAGLRNLPQSSETDKVIAETEFTNRTLRASAKAEEYGRVIRFYLPRKHRKEFIELVRRAQGALDSENSEEMETILASIQEVLESALDG
jgi:hypothetical protein